MIESKYINDTVIEDCRDKFCGFLTNMDPRRIRIPCIQKLLLDDKELGSAYNKEVEVLCPCLQITNGNFHIHSFNLSNSNASQKTATIPSWPLAVHRESSGCLRQGKDMDMGGLVVHLSQCQQRQRK